MAALRVAMGENDFRLPPWAEGAALSTEDAITYAQRGRGLPKASPRGRIIKAGRGARFSGHSLAGPRAAVPRGSARWHWPLEQRQQVGQQVAARRGCALT